MSRYIDADEFLEDESEAYMRAQVSLAKENADKTIDATRYVNEAVHKKIQMLIKEAPSADVVEVVRCKDCKHHEELLNNNDGNVLCWVHDIDVIVDGNGYCNYGKRKEQENE